MEGWVIVFQRPKTVAYELKSMETYLTAWTVIKKAING
jgi:hypothetical protein